ncbi:MAG TPA: DNA repair protein RadC [Chthonomonadales bacterium]|nr:DNA repair protein RadC [Chthonomonadales bacterium]
MAIGKIDREEAPRERLVRYGAQSLSTEELISMLLGTGTAAGVSAATRLLAKFGGSSGLARAAMRDVAKVHGVGLHRAAQLMASIELGRRMTARVRSTPAVVRGPEDVADLLLPSMQGSKQEQFTVLLLDTKHNVLKITPVSVGTLDASLVHPREVFREAIASSAAAIIVAHNHPSGDPTPSEEDRRVTERLMAAGQLIGIEVLDHVIVGDDRWVSMKRQNLV